MQDNARSFQVGEFTCYWVSDGYNIYPRGAIFADAPEDQLAGVLAPEEFTAGQLTIPYTALLVEAGAHRILLDTGAGPLAPTTGRLIDNLRAAGPAPETVNLVVLSHAHPDHIGGTVGEDGDLTFPHARFFMLRAEFEYWMAEATQAKLGSGELYGAGGLEQVIRDWIRKYLPPIADRIELLDRDAEIAPGVRLLPALGHTPGHLAVMISSGGQQLLYAGDAFVHPAQVERPQWNCMFESDRRRAEQTRRQLLDRAVADPCLLAASHFPGVVRVVRRDTEFGLELPKS